MEFSHLQHFLKDTNWEITVLVSTDLTPIYIKKKEITERVLGIHQLELDCIHFNATI
jgi:hypothetical protein